MLPDIVGIVRRSEWLDRTREGNTDKRYEGR